MGEWTPGPWRINKYGGIGAGEFGVDPIVVDSLGFDGRSAPGDMRLIAAAPQLLEACRRMEPVLKWLESCGEGSVGKSVAEQLRTYVEAALRAVEGQ